MATYTMIVIDNGTRIRADHNTASVVLTSVNANVMVTGNELFTASSQLSNTAGVYQMVGDKWLKITYNGVTGWMSYIHKGLPICRDFKEVGIVDPPPTPVFPEFFTLTDPSGAKAEYQFVRIIE